MRRRLVVVYLSLLVAACLGLAGPLCAAIASSNTGEMVLDRSNDTVRFASLAGPALERGESESLAAELRAYEELYGIHAVVVDRHGEEVVASGAAPSARGEVRTQVRAALAGNRGGTAEVLWPWDTAPLVVVEPVVRSGEVVGAVVTVSPTDALRGTILRQWAIILAGVLVLLTGGVAAADPLVRWVLRPVRDLERATRSISGGRLDTRVRSEAGPPELRRLSESFNTMAATITDILRRQRDFVSYAGHQVRNPLAALRLRVDALAVHLDPSGRDDHALTLDEVDRLTRICDSLLELARTEPVPQRAEPHEVRATAESRVAAWHPIATRSGAALRCCGAREAWAACPAGLIDQVLDVLIDNALKFGGAHPQVSVHVGRPRNGTVTVHVVDDGPGLAPAQLQRATTPFWRAGEGPAGDGVGLGLSIVARLMEIAGGELHLEPARPHGIDAAVRLPAASSAVEEGSAGGAAGSAADGARPAPDPDPGTSSAAEEGRTGGDSDGARPALGPDYEME